MLLRRHTTNTTWRSAPPPDDARQALETIIQSITDVFEEIFEYTGAFKDSIPRDDHPALIKKMSEFFKLLAPQLVQISKTVTEHNLKKQVISNLVMLLEILTSSRFPNEPNSESEITKLIGVVIQLLGNDQFFSGIIQQQYPSIEPTRRGRAEPSNVAKEADAVQLKRDTKMLRALLDHPDLTKEQLSDLIGGSAWQSIIRRTHPELIALLLTHPKAVEVLRVNVHSPRPIDTEADLNCTQVLAALFLRAYPAHLNFQTRDLFQPTQVSCALTAIKEIAKLEFYELTRGTQELRSVIKYIEKEESPSSDDLKIECLDALKKRLESIESANAERAEKLTRVLGGLCEFFSNALGDHARKDIEKSITDRSAKRPDIKIHSIIQDLVDIHNFYAESGETLRYKNGIFVKPGPEIAIKTLLDVIQKNNSDHPNYTFKLKQAEEQKAIELEWGEKFQSVRSNDFQWPMRR